MKTINNIIHFFGIFFRKNIKTTEQAIKMGLTHKENIYGDEINHQNCRSWWHDENYNFYRCDQLL